MTTHHPNTNLGRVVTYLGRVVTYLGRGVTYMAPSKGVLKMSSSRRFFFKLLTMDQKW